MEKQELDEAFGLRELVDQHSEAIYEVQGDIDAITTELRKHGIVVPRPILRRPDKTDELRE